MQRGSPMKRSVLRRKVLERAAEKRRYDTGPTGKVKAIVLRRARGRCELCGQEIRGAYSYHHRQPRGRGGSKARPWINKPSNIMLVDGSGVTGCHALIESQRALAYANGWLVRYDDRPAEIPVELFVGLRYLDDDGNLVEGNP